MTQSEQLEYSTGQILLGLETLSVKDLLKVQEKVVQLLNIKVTTLLDSNESVYSSQNHEVNNNSPIGLDVPFPVEDDLEDDVVDDSEEDDEKETMLNMFPTSSPLKNSQGSKLMNTFIPIDEKDHITSTQLDHNEELIPKPESNGIIEIGEPDSLGIELEDNLFKFKAKKQPRKIYDFNKNPISKVGWILEDFKPNEQLSYSSTNNKNRRKLLNFDEMFERNSKKHFFKNLQVRSSSPPGFGRLDFPTTQERMDDREKAGIALRKKTMERFCMASNHKIPPWERLYLFRNSELNRIVDDGDFVWQEDNLDLYVRL